MFSHVAGECPCVPEVQPIRPTELRARLAKQAPKLYEEYLNGILLVISEPVRFNLGRDDELSSFVCHTHPRMALTHALPRQNLNMLSRPFTKLTKPSPTPRRQVSCRACFGHGLHAETDMGSVTVT